MVINCTKHLPENKTQKEAFVNTSFYSLGSENFEIRRCRDVANNKLLILFLQAWLWASWFPGGPGAMEGSPVAPFPTSSHISPVSPAPLADRLLWVWLCAQECTCMRTPSECPCRSQVLLHRKLAFQKETPWHSGSN